MATDADGDTSRARSIADGFRSEMTRGSGGGSLRKIKRNSNEPRTSGSSSRRASAAAAATAAPSSRRITRYASMGPGCSSNTTQQQDLYRDGGGSRRTQQHRQASLPACAASQSESASISVLGRPSKDDTRRYGRASDDDGSSTGRSHRHRSLPFPDKVPPITSRTDHERSTSASGSASGAAVRCSQTARPGVVFASKEADQINLRLKEKIMSNCGGGGHEEEGDTVPVDDAEVQSRVVQAMKEMHTSRTNDLLFDIPPPHVARALRDGKRVEPEERDCVTVFFSDIVGYTDLSSRVLSPIKVSDLLDRLYSAFDEISWKHGVYKMETIGDAWMGVTNLIQEQPDDHARRIAEFACDAVRVANCTLIDADDPTHGFVNIRVGFHSGPVVATVVGRRNPRYVLIGDTVNVASRMESQSERNRIHCSQVSADLLREQAPEISLRCRGEIQVKGKGAMKTYWVLTGSDDEANSEVSGWTDEERSYLTSNTGVDGNGAELQLTEAEMEEQCRILEEIERAQRETQRQCERDLDGSAGSSGKRSSLVVNNVFDEADLEEQRRMWEKIERKQEEKQRRTEQDLDLQLRRARISSNLSEKSRGESLGSAHSIRRDSLGKDELFDVYDHKLIEEQRTMFERLGESIADANKFPPHTQECANGDRHPNSEIFSRRPSKGSMLDLAIESILKEGKSP